MSLVIATLTLACVMAILALGIHISFRVFRTADITADGSFPLGAAVAAVLISSGTHPLVATMMGAAAGCGAGMCAGLIHTKLRVNALLSGIIVMTGLYSVNLRVMGRSNLPFTGARTIFSPMRDWLTTQVDGDTHLMLIGSRVSLDELAALLTSGLIVGALTLTLWWFLRTELGSAMRASGDNPRVMRALGADTDLLFVAGIALANALVGLCGALFAQLQGFADAQMGIGVIVLGLASVIIGQSLVGQQGVFIPLVGTVVGTVLFRLLVSIAIRAGLNPNDLKLVTALVVLATLAAPAALGRLKASRRSQHAPA